MTGTPAQDHPDFKEPNLRYELRAYEDTDACRLAAIITDLGADTVDRSDVRTRWVERYPRHVKKTGRQRLGNRISGALTMLSVAGIVRVHDDAVTVLDRQRLAMSAANLAIVQDAEGVALRPSAWAEQPQVPEHLRAVAGRLGATRRPEAR